MKKAVILMLGMVNIALLAWVLTINVTPAKAQTARNLADYIQVSGRVGKDNEAVYVLDLRTRTLKAWYYDTTSRKLEEMRARDLVADFKSRDKDK